MKATLHCCVPRILLAACFCSALVLAPTLGQENVERPKGPTPASGPPGPNWLELAVGSHGEDILHRHFLRVQLLDQVQALICDKAARPEHGPLNALDGRLVVQRGRRMWLDLSRLEKETAAEMQRLAGAKAPKDRLDLMTELREHVAQTYYDLRAPYKSLAELQKAHPYKDNPDYLRVPVDSDIFEGRRVIHVSKDRVADALASYADKNDRVIYPPGTAFVCEALDEEGRFHEAEVLFKRPDGYWTFLIYDREGRLSPHSLGHKGPTKGKPRMMASFGCSGCHRMTREDLSEGLGAHGANYLERLGQRVTTWPQQVQLGEEYRERKAYELTEIVLRRRDAVFGPYGALLLSELMHKQKTGKLSEADRKRYERLRPHFRTILPAL